MNGETPMIPNDKLQSTKQNSCRGYMSYTTGPEYVFTVENYTADCDTQIVTNNNKVTFKNSVQGLPAAKVCLSCTTIVSI